MCLNFIKTICLQRSKCFNSLKMTYICNVYTHLISKEINDNGHIYIKGVTVRFGFDVLELRKFKLLVRNKATDTPYGMYYTRLDWIWVAIPDLKDFIYICVGLSLLVLTRRAMRRP